MSELKTIARHAGSILAGQLATIAFGVTDTIVSGRYAESSLAALSVGTAIYMTVYVALIGVLQALLPIWSELHGANHPIQLGRSVRQSLYLFALAMVLGVWALLSPHALLQWSQVPAALHPEVTRYLSVLALALPPSLLFRLYSTLNQSLGRPMLVTWLQLGSLLIKVPLSIWFTFGGWGLSAQGVVGCAWATLLVNYVMLCIAVTLLRIRPLYRPYRLWSALEKPDWPTLAAFARLGIPSGLTILVEVTSFTLMALFIARLGTTAAASHQIAANLTTALYMIPLAIGIATSARTSYWLGAGQARQAGQTVRQGFALTMSCAGVLACTVYTLRQPLAELYANSPEVVALSAGLLGWIAVYHVFDAAQALAVFVLRSFRITLLPLLLYSLLLWGLGLYGGYTLAYQGFGPWAAQPSPAAFWGTAAAALGLAASVFWVLIWQVLRRANVS